MLNIFSLSTNELVAQLREGQISSVEVCKAYLERVEKFEKDVSPTIPEPLNILKIKFSI